MKPASIIYVDQKGNSHPIKKIVAHDILLKFYKDSKGRVILKHVTA